MQEELAFLFRKMHALRLIVQYCSHQEQQPSWRWRAQGATRGRSVPVGWRPSTAAAAMLSKTIAASRAPEPPRFSLINATVASDRRALCPGCQVIGYQKRNWLRSAKSPNSSAQTSITTGSDEGPERSRNLPTAASKCRRSYPFFCCRFRNRTPGPPPFSSMNSTPAVSNARLMTFKVARRGVLAVDSNCLTVTIPTPARSARSCCVQSRSPRAALHCAEDSISAKDESIISLILSKND
jgi:hypothetical protein